MNLADLMQIMEPADIRIGLHSIILHYAPEYFPQEVQPGQPTADLPMDWADAIEDERSLAESIAVYPHQLTREDLLARLTQQLALCRSGAWKRVRPEMIVRSVSRLIHPAGEQSA